MNPCPCGHAGSGGQPCRCGPLQVARYRARLSGPLLDRIDVHLSVPPVDLAALENDAPGESSAVVRARVLAARNRQALRLGSGRCNA
ncbi:MAG: ATP-binding protein, partial [Ilumatobacteraceae bacterium]